MATVWSARRVAVGAAAVMSVLLTGCGGDDPDSADGTTTTVASDTTAAPEATAAPDGGDAEDVVDPAEWQLIEVTATGGETFTVADLAGRPVLVENFATWCSSCRNQLEATQDAAEVAGDDAVFLALSVETELSLADMEEYQKANGFTNIRFAVMSPELLAAMDQAFGTSALNPPSTPKIAVAANGAAGELVTGPESAEEILTSLGLS
jgi:thiol-disulfide isomerase/thioredoxin